MTFHFDPEHHRYTLDGLQLPSVTQILDGAGHRAPFKFPEGVADRGHAVHAACQFDDEDDLDEDSVGSEIMGYVYAWRIYKAETGLEILENEQPLYHPTMMYAGCIDRVIVRNGQKAILDIKSGVRFSHHALQLEGYAQAYEAAHGLELESPHVAVYLAKDGTWKEELWSDRANLGPVWNAAYLTYNWKQRN